LGEDQSLEPGAVVLLRVSIGPLDPDSLERSPVIFPDHLLPAEDVWLRVLVASSDFQVGADADDLARAELAVEKPFLLPADGSPAHTEREEQWLWFALRVPERTGPASARVNYYYRDALIQSQRLTAIVGTGRGRLEVVTDYTASALLHDLDEIPDTPRVSILLNDGPGTTHQLLLRPSRDTPAERSAVPISLPGESVGPLVDKLRVELARTVTSKRVHSSKQLENDLRRLAPLGRDLHRKLLVGGAGEVFQRLHQRPRPLLAVTRPKNVTFTLPWNCLYRIGLPSVPIEKVPVCPLVSEWKEREPLVDGPVDTCPWEEKGVSHAENLLCPFGFWGFGLTVESPASAWSAQARVKLMPSATVVVAETKSGIDRKSLDDHVARLQSMFDSGFPKAGVNVVPETTRAQIRAQLSYDLPLVYFFCHGQRDRVNSPDIYLGVGAKDIISVGDFIDWVEASWLTDQIIWHDVRPLVFINACEALEVSPRTLCSYVDAFVGLANAMGVVGTEVKVPQNLAMEYAEIFFNELLVRHRSISEAQQVARFAFLATGNLFGLAYTAHAWAHLTVVARSAVE